MNAISYLFVGQVFALLKLIFPELNRPGKPVLFLQITADRFLGQEVRFPSALVGKFS